MMDLSSTSSSMNRFKLWLKNRHDINALNEAKFKKIENDLAEYFGGIRGLMRLALQNRDNLSYAQLLRLSVILDNDEKEYTAANSQHFSINSISESSLSNICSYLVERDEFHLKCANRSLFYSQFGTFQFNKADIYRYKIRENDQAYEHLSIQLRRSIQNILTKNDAKSIRKMIELHNKMDNYKLAFKNTGLLPHLKNIILKSNSSSYDVLKLFTILISLDKCNFCTIFDTKLLAYFAQVLSSNKSSNGHIMFVLKCLSHIMKRSPQFLCHIIKHIHEIILHKLVKWRTNLNILPLALQSIVFCMQNDDNLFVTNDVYKTKDFFLKIICSLIKSLHTYLTKQWKQNIHKGMRILITLDKETQIRLVQRVIYDKKCLDQSSKNDKKIWRKIQKYYGKMMQKNNGIWVETTYKRDKEYFICTLDIRHDGLEYVPGNHCLLCFELLLDMLLKVRILYNNKQDINLKQLGIFPEIKYIFDLLARVLCAPSRGSDSELWIDAKKGSYYMRLLLLLFRIDLINVWQLEIFDTEKVTRGDFKNLDRPCRHITCGDILQVIMEKDEKIVIGYLEKYRHFFEYHFSQFGLYNRETFGAGLTIKLIQFVYNTIHNLNYNNSDEWSKEQLASFFQMLVPGVAHVFDAEKMQSFIVYNGYEIVIKLSRYLLEIYDSEFIFAMVSHCIDLLVAIIKHAKHKLYNIVFNKCCACMLEILAHKKLMHHMKCSDGVRVIIDSSFKVSFKNILSIPSRDIIDTTLLYLNEKKGDIQDWYHNRSLQWIVRLVVEDVSHSYSTINDVMSLANIVEYASDKIKLKLNYKECLKIMNLVVDSLPIYYSDYSSYVKPKKEVIFKLLGIIAQFGQSYGILNDKCKGKLLRMYNYKQKYDDNNINQIQNMLIKFYNIDVKQIDNKKI